jgi:hypothetical protein
MRGHPVRPAERLAEASEVAEGWGFDLLLSAGLPSGPVIRGRATIVSNFNDPINTPQVHKHRRRG